MPRKSSLRTSLLVINDSFVLRTSCGRGGFARGGADGRGAGRAPMPPKKGGGERLSVWRCFVGVLIPAAVAFWNITGAREEKSVWL